MSPTPIDADRFATEDDLRRWCERLCGAGLRATGGTAHEEVLAWLEGELATVPGLTVRRDPIDILRWAPEGGDLAGAATLAVGGEPVPVAGAVPYSRPTTATGPLTVLPPGAAVGAEHAGRVVLVDFPDIPLPYDALFGLGDHVTAGCDDLRGEVWDRPGLADSILHALLLAAGEAGAAAVVIAFDLPREQVAGYFEPHKGTHYALPAVFVGVGERDRLRAAAARGDGPAQVTVRAEVAPATTANLVATLPGRSPERIVLVTHTDGATWVQENGAAALLALAHHLAGLPADDRQRTVELAFTTAHLHISREGSAQHAARLDAEYDDGTVAAVVAVEHLGAREVVPVPRPDGPGRHLVATGGSEPVLWAVGPSDALRAAVVDAVEGRDLDRVVVAPGFGAAVEGQVPRIVSFGGLGTHFHVHLLPTTSVITGPWTLWAPTFGPSAIDIGLLRRQALAVGDVVRALDAVPRETLAGGYLADRAARAAGAPVGVEPVPPEVAPG